MMTYDLREPNELYSYYYFVDDIYVRTWKNFLRNGDAFIDVGANVGFYSAHMASFVGPTGIVLAIEPNPPMCRRLENLARINSFANIRIITQPASDHCFQTKLLVGSDHGLTRLQNSQGIVYGIDVQSQIDVSTTTIDSLLGMLDGRQVRGIKLDIEGHEYHALRGALSVISTYRPLIQMEFNPELMKQFQIDPASLLTLFKDLDYLGVVPAFPRDIVYNKRKIKLRELASTDAVQGIHTDVWWCPKELQPEFESAWDKR